VATFGQGDGDSEASEASTYNDYLLKDVSLRQKKRKKKHVPFSSVIDLQRR
jgi:hypothetical protein